MSIDYKSAVLSDKEFRKPGEPLMEEWVNRFLTWKLPVTVKPDLCALDTSYPHRTGTNLLSAAEARQMLEHVLNVTGDDVGRHGRSGGILMQ